MKPTFGLLALTLLVAFFWNSAHSGPSAATAAPSRAMAGTWTTGAVGTLGDVVYPASQDAYYIDLATEGLYDPVLWVVILDYNTLTIQSGATVRFLNHPSRAPVVIRAVGEIVIDGELNLDGEDGHSASEFPCHSEPGPGGFRGGTGPVPSLTPTTDGHGPGGGYNDGSTTSLGAASGSHATVGAANSFGATPGPTYGSGFAFPLIGGSGGTGVPPYPPWNQTGGGGAGGGAVLIGSDASLSLSGRISARGGAGIAQYPWGGQHAGSGGVIRLASPVITWQGTGSLLDASGGPTGGGLGWIRVETIGTPTGGEVPAVPGAVHAQHLGEFLPATLPTVTVASWWDDSSAQWVPMTQDPHAIIDNGGEADGLLPDSGLRTLRLEGHDVPLGAPLHVRITDTQGRAVIDSTHTMGEVQGSTPTQSWTDVQVDFALGVSTVQVRAELR